MLIKLPFDGFYESIHDSNIEYAIESMFSDDHGTVNIPESFDDQFDYAMAHKQYAKLFAAQVQDYLLNEHGLKITLDFDNLDSPRFYNYETDRIFCHITAHDVNMLYAITPTSELILTAKDRHTSCSGFISSYDPDVSTWGKVNTWDCNQLETLLLAFARYDDSNVMDETHEDVSSIIDDCMNDKCTTIYNKHYSALIRSNKC